MNLQEKLPETITGSKNFYVKNNFNHDKFSYAVYSKYEDWKDAKCLPERYVTTAEALADQVKKVATHYCFEVMIKGEHMIYLDVDFEGKIMKGGRMFKDYIKEKMRQHGKDNVNYKFKRI